MDNLTELCQLMRNVCQFKEIDSAVKKYFKATRRKKEIIKSTRNVKKNRDQTFETWDGS